MNLQELGASVVVAYMGAQELMGNKNLQDMMNQHIGKHI
jgi:hypothetical protein